MLSINQVRVLEKSNGEDTYGEALQRWASDQQALANLQRQTKALLVAIEGMQAAVGV